MAAIRKAGFTLLAWLLVMAAWADNPKTPLLERIVTLQCQNESIAEVLKKLGQQAGCTFSYSSSIIDVNRRVTQQFTKKTVRQVLDQVFVGGVQYRERRRYIIITALQTKLTDTRQISGYIVDEATGEALQNVSVYDPITLQSAITNAYGYFQLEVPKPSNKEVRLAVNKANYTDTLIAVPDHRGLLNIPLKINKERISVLTDSLGNKLKRFWMTTLTATRQAINMENIDTTMYRTFQFSFVPFVGTNHALSGNIINDYSLNAWGGYSLGVQKLEVGGLFNVVQGDVKGVQIGGIINAVGGRTDGVQVAGMVNAGLGSVRGVQVAGLVNFTWDTAWAPGLAGFVNFSRRDSRAPRLAGLANVTLGKQLSPHIAGLFNFSWQDARTAQVAGLYNFVTDSMSGVQVGGLLNLTLRSTHGAQVGGLANITGGHLKGVQVGGLLNVVVDSIQGAQISGMVNVATGNLQGAQVGVVNYARRLKGVQVGLLNITGAAGGTPIGMLSITGKGGYHTLEISADEVFYTNLAFRTGVRAFYNILTAGVRPNTLNKDETFWSFGYGLGTAPRISDHVYLNIDLTSSQIVAGNKFEGVNMLNKLYLGVEYRLSRNLGLIAGATLNGYITDTDYEYPELFADYKPSLIKERTYSDNILYQMWWGGKIGIRFF
ncbi:STN domain-containing protein [Fulvivirgaceae bacterium PWU5]|uniref:STN domain-containing protein n=1 Tax=Dawidia cretensis TaxID=2782350 RepID=A0AAP2GSX0_9BACT|nr:STN and carboxypeptidase regulatory-like domain-containing protein [Dawidia cretensis]MBT1712241.1 STN domain-containing protein [Dawidia cretensis]